MPLLGLDSFGASWPPWSRSTSPTLPIPWVGEPKEGNGQGWASSENWLPTFKAGYWTFGEGNRGETEKFLWPDSEDWMVMGAGTHLSAGTRVASPILG